MVKRKFSASSSGRTKRMRSMFKRPRGKYARTFKRKGQRFPTYKFHRYINSLGKYSFPSGYFNESFLPFTVTPGATGNESFPFAWAFTINDVATLSEFSSLFDRYMITGVQVKVQLVSNPDADTARPQASGSYYPKLWWAIDHDDAGIATLAQLKEYGNVRCRVLRPNNILKIWVPYPRVTSMVYQTGGAQASGVASRPQWLDLGFPNAEHYGLKMCVDTDGISVSSTSNPFRLKLEAKYYFKCKDVR